MRYPVTNSYGVNFTYVRYMPFVLNGTSPLDGKKPVAKRPLSFRRAANFRLNLGVGLRWGLGWPVVVPRSGCWASGGSQVGRGGAGSPGRQADYHRPYGALP